MTDDLVARLRDLGIRSADLAADRIEALTARAEAAEARAEAAEAERDAMAAERDRAIDDAIYNAQYVDLVLRYRTERDAAEAERDRLREALTLAERLYYLEGKDAGWRAARMNGVARSAQNGEDLTPYHRIFPRSAALKGQQP
jgi:hypothetical protein